MKLDYKIDAKELLALFAGLILGYLCVMMAIELELYFYQSRFVIGKLYQMIQEKESENNVSEARVGRAKPKCEQSGRSTSDKFSNTTPLHNPS